MKLKIKNRTKTVFWLYLEDNIWGILPGKILHFFGFNQPGEYEIDEAVLAKIEVELEKYAWEKLLKFLAYRERSRQEAYRSLAKFGFKKPLINKLLAKAEDYNYLNDKRFAEIFCQSLQNKGKSKREIRSKMFQKGVDENLLEKVLVQSYSKQQEDEIIAKNLGKACRRYSDLEKNKQREKIINYMVRKGFNYHEVVEALNEKGE